MSNRPFAVKDGVLVPFEALKSPAEAIGFDERCFGEEAARQFRQDDSQAFAAVSWILFAIVLSGCLLMLGTVVVVSFLGNA